jgi:hypothetical protein
VEEAVDEEEEEEEEEESLKISMNVSLRWKRYTKGMRRMRMYVLEDEVVVLIR